MRARHLLHTFLITVIAWGGAATRAETPVSVAPPTTAPSSVALKHVPENLSDLRALQARVQEVVRRVSPAVVGLRVGGQGSGVLISDDGYILTAGHVASAPGRDVTVILSNGKFARAKSLGVNYGMDSGLIKIIEKPPEGGWPYVEMGRSGSLQRGQWCIVMGHPGGFKFGRTPPVRLGHVLDTRANGIRTDCTLVGGDSGGPLFDLDGKVIGINSRIGNSLNDNMHVPIDAFHESWDRLVDGEAWGQTFFVSRPGGPYLGFQVDRDAADARVGEIYPESPAQKIGLKKGDVITKFGGQPIANSGELLLYLARQRPGDEVPVEVRRGDAEFLKLRITVGKRPTTQPVPTPPPPPSKP
jgi:serine protease Do